MQSQLKGMKQYRQLYEQTKNNLENTQEQLKLVKGRQSGLVKAMVKHRDQGCNNS
jgi:hypothetical protein